MTPSRLRLTSLVGLGLLLTPTPTHALDLELPAAAPVSAPAAVAPPLLSPQSVLRWDQLQMKLGEARTLLAQTRSSTASSSATRPVSGAALPTAPLTVAVLDTGWTDPLELRGQQVGGYDFVSDPDRAGDGDGRDPDARDPLLILEQGKTVAHGTMVAGLIGSSSAEPRYAGIAPGVRIVQVRVADRKGEIFLQDAIDALRWSAGLGVTGVPLNPNPARIINLSFWVDDLPQSGCDPRMQKAIDEVTARNALVVAGAGNENLDAKVRTPAACRNVLSVGATERSGLRASYSNWGSKVTISAPGGSRSDTIPVLAGALERQERTGTSLAAPQVSGVAALVLQANPGLSARALKTLLERTATRFPTPCDPDPRKSCGAGIVNALEAVRAALPALSSAPSPRPSRPVPPAPPLR